MAIITLLALVLALSSFAESSWQIVDTPGYTTDDVIVASVVLDANRLPDSPEENDCSGAFELAFEEAESMGGGFVYAPPGEYMFANPIIIPPNVVLRGSLGSVAGKDKSVRGTILIVAFDGREPDGDPAFIQLDLRAGLRDLSIWYPKQRLDDIIPYSRTIDGKQGSNPDELNIENVNLVNSYVGLSIQDNAKRLFVRGLFGTPLKTGIYQKLSSSVPFYSDIDFSAEYWSESGLPGAPSNFELKQYLRRSATGVNFGSSDNIFASEMRVSDYRIGFHFERDVHGDVNGNMYGLVARRCKIGLLAESIGPSFIINSFFEGRNVAVYVNNRNPVGVFFEGCTFKGEVRSILEGRSSTGHTARNLRFHTCSFDSPLIAGVSNLNVVSSTFAYSSGPPIQLHERNGYVTLAGNTFTYVGNPIDRNGGHSNNILVDHRPTYSQTYTPFDIKDYQKTRITADNLIIMGKGRYRVAVDGITDDSVIIQRALNKIGSRGGGIVFLPPISQKGYAIHSPLNVPSGCELRSTAEGLHSFNRQEDIPGALLQIFHGRNANEPTIILNKGSGFKGFTIHYPEQFMDNITPYSVTIKAIGDGTYVTNTHFLNSYDMVEFNGVDGFLAEKILGQHIHRPFKVVQSHNGRFNRNMVRNEWDDSGFSTVTGVEYAQEYSTRECVAYEAVKSSNLQIFACFTRLSNWLANFNDSTVFTLQFKIEACQNGVRVNGGFVSLIGTSVRTKTNIPSKSLTMWEANSGDLHVFSALADGYPDTVLRAIDANVVIQNSAFTIEPKVPTNGLQVKGANHGVVRIENCIFQYAYISTQIPKAEGKRLELVANSFSGLDYFSYPGEVENSLDASFLDGVRLAEVANLVRRGVSCQMNLEEPGESGLELKTYDYIRKTRDYYFKNTIRTLSGYVPTGESKTLLFEVTSSPFDQGHIPSDATIKFLYYDWKPGTLVVEYKLAGLEKSWKTAKEIALRGDGGFVLLHEKGKRNPYFVEREVNVKGRVFIVGTKVRLTVKKGKAMFMYVNVEDAEIVWLGGPSSEIAGRASDANPCVVCTNSPNSFMRRIKQTCEEWRRTEKNCQDPSQGWKRSMTCKRSCFELGYPYDDGICCPEV